MKLLNRILLISVFLSWASGPTYASTVEIVLQSSQLLRQGNAYLQDGDIQKAKKILARALDSNLTNSQLANVHNSMCVAHIKEEDWNTAIEHCDAAISKVPTNWRFHNNLGNIYFGLGDYGLAMKSYRKGLSIAPRSITIAANIEMLEAYVQRRPHQVSFDPT